MRVAICIILGAAMLTGQSRVSKQGGHRMEIVLEKFNEGSWKVVDPSLVLERNDRVRFRFKSNFAGFLYVTNRSTSHTTTLLFPRQDTGHDNRILPNREYLVPATRGAFRVEGPAGYDVVAWTVSPVELGRPEPPPPPTEPPANLIPRCDDSVLRARGECLDTAAGPQAKDENSDLTFIRGKQSSVISSPGPLQAPIVYEFRLAHR